MEDGEDNGDNNYENDDDNDDDDDDSDDGDDDDDDDDDEGDNDEDDGYDCDDGAYHDTKKNEANESTTYLEKSPVCVSNTGNAPNKFLFLRCPRTPGLVAKQKSSSRIILSAFISKKFTLIVKVRVKHVMPVQIF